MKTVSVDWDYLPEDIPGKIRETLRLVPYFYPIHSCKYRISSSGSGIHILVTFNTDISDCDSLFVRALLRDDYMRLRLDMCRYVYDNRPIGLIFSQKCDVSTGEILSANEWITVET
jgi:hypothetical protein